MMFKKFLLLRTLPQSEKLIIIIKSALGQSSWELVLN